MVSRSEMAVELRDERDSDLAAIRELNRAAFGQDQEANIVDALRANGAALLSLVAIADGKVVGHIMYSPLTIADQITGAVLGPMAVHPDYQRDGIGSRLVEEGSRRLENLGYPFILVVGIPAVHYAGTALSHRRSDRMLGGTMPSGAAILAP